MNNIKYTFILLLCAFFAVSCNEDLFIPDNIHNSILAPSIASFEPSSGEPGTLITIKGNNLSSVQSAMIGGEETQILYRYTNNDIVIKTTGNERSGKITLVNPKGNCESEQSFTVIDITPSVSDINPVPTEWTAYDEYQINGDNLNGVYDITIGSVKMQLLDKNDNRLVFKIPYFESSEPLDLLLFYKQNGTAMSITAASGLSVNNPVIPPVITTEIPEQVFPETQLILQGEYLDRITAVKFDDSAVKIISQEPAELKIMVPSIPSEVSAVEGVLSIVHNGGLETIIDSEFVIATGTVYNYVYWSGITLGVRCYESSLQYENNNNFFNCATGQIYSACDYESIKNEIDFFFSISGGNIQLNNPQSSTSQIKNFKCRETGALPSEAGVNTTKYYILKDDVPAEYELKQKVLANQLDYIKLSMLDTTLGISAAASNPGSNNPRWRDFPGITDNTSYWRVGDVMVFRTTTDGEYPGKMGFMQIVDVYLSGTTADTNPETSIYKSTVTINVWYQKKLE
ncbi:MAG: IPT/TIG domain-containing protein [Bacteroidales bacterium]|jgi:hypothetical protein|nr:IPT/TIG domain-containing protein [Bacteroidales bacterium]